MNRGNLYMAHKCGFSWKSLNNKLHLAGFPMVYGGQYPDIFALKAVAFKSLQENEYSIEVANKYLK